MMAGITGHIQMGDEIVNPILIQANPDGKPLLQRRRANSLPSLWNAVDPRVFHFEVRVPAFV